MPAGTAKCNVCTDFSNLRKSNFAGLEKPKEEQECPPDSGELGRATWTFLHTMAAYYPETPTQEDKLEMNQMIKGLSKFYPCGYCAEHMRQDMKIHPPIVDSNKTLSTWFCDLHNKVNKRQGKPEFDCSRVMERWKDGYKGSDCFKSI